MEHLDKLTDSEIKELVESNQLNRSELIYLIGRLTLVAEELKSTILLLDRINNDEITDGFYLIISEVSDMIEANFPQVETLDWWLNPIEVNEGFYNSFRDLVILDVTEYKECFTNSKDHLPFGVDLQLIEKQNRVIRAQLLDASVFNTDGVLDNQYFNTTST